MRQRTERETQAEQGACSTWDWKLHFLQHLGVRRGGPGRGGGISCSWQPYGEGTRSQRGSLGSAAGGPCFARRKRCGWIPSPRVHRAARSCLQRGRAGRCRPQLRCPSLPSTIYSQARLAAPPAPLMAAAAATMGRWEGGKPLPKQGRRTASRGCRGWSSGVSSNQIWCKAPRAGSVPQERQKQAPSSPPNPFPSCHLGVLGSAPHPTPAKPFCLCS